MEVEESRKRKNGEKITPRDYRDFPGRGWNAMECEDWLGVAARVHFPFIQFSPSVGGVPADLEHERVVAPRETTRNNAARNNGVAVTIPASGVSLSLSLSLMSVFLFSVSLWRDAMGHAECSVTTLLHSLLHFLFSLRHFRFK